MPLFLDDSTEERRRLVSEASRARSRGRTRRAIALYQQLLAAEPANVEIAVRIAPLLAFEGRNFEAWTHFRSAGKALLRSKRGEWCLSVFREATRSLPFEFDAWRITADLERKLGRPEEAYQTLLEGRRHFRSAPLRAQAIALLELAREIVPWDPHVVVDLALLLARNDQAPQGIELLESLALRCPLDELPVVRGAQWRITRSPHHAWRWIKAALAGFRGELDPHADRSLPSSRTLMERSAIR